MGEFGRTPVINPNGGRDHFPLAWSTVMGGGGLNGGQVVGDTGKAGAEVVDRPVQVKDFYATICQAVGLNPNKENISTIGRPISLAEAGAEAVKEVLRS